MGHVKEHCDMPRINRTWKKLGTGATWICDCGRQYRLVEMGCMDGSIWSWEEVKR